MTGNGVNSAALQEFAALLAAPLPQLDGVAPVTVDLRLLATLGSIVSADLVVFNDLAPTPRWEWGSCSADLPFDDAAVEEEEEEDEDPELDFWHAYRSDRVCNLELTRDIESLRVLSDFHTLREWRAGLMHRIQNSTWFGDYDRMLMVPLPAPPGRSRRIRFLRKSGRDFDDTDRALATLIRPHLVAHLHDLDLAHRGIQPLTARQRQLMSLVARGYTNTQAARTLGISAQTVRTHLQQIYARLGVNSRGEAAALVTPTGTLGPIRSQRVLSFAE